MSTPACNLSAGAGAYELLEHLRACGVSLIVTQRRSLWVEPAAPVTIGTVRAIASHAADIQRHNDRLILLVTALSKRRLN